MALVLVEARRHEGIDLPSDHGKGDEGGAEHGELQVGEELLQKMRRDELGLVGPHHAHEWPDQHIVNVVGEIKAHHEGDQKGDDGLDEPRAQLDQMLHQGRFGGFDVSVGHAAPPVLRGAWSGVGSA